MASVSVKSILAGLCVLAAAGLADKASAAEVTESSRLYVADSAAMVGTSDTSTLYSPAAQSDDKQQQPTEGKESEDKGSGFKRHFTWGVDVGASVDLSGENMSTFDTETHFGYKGSFIRTAAIGAGIHKAFGNKYTFVPLFAVIRTSFRSKPSLMFLELKAGYSFNTLTDSGSFGGAYGSLGLGINLAMTKSFKSHIILAYSFYTLHQATDLEIPCSGDNINYAVLKIGVNF